MSCQALFEGLPNGRGEVSARAKLIDDSFPDAFCECESVSRFSPGVVAGGEFLHRFVFSPLHMHDGEVLPALFSDAKDKGLSCERGDALQIAPQTHERGRQQAQRFNETKPEDRPERAYVGSVTASCSLIRALLMNEQRLLAIYDTALEENVAHADVFEIAGRTNAEKKQARKDIADAFSKVPVSG